jgi:NDP-sugar pyrophosphorylase family protein
MHLRYLPDGPTLRGTGGAVKRALPALGPAFFVMYGDSYLTCDFSAVERAYQASGHPALMTVFKNDDQFDRSNVEFANGVIIRYDKVNRDARMRHIDYGLGILTAGVFEPYAEDQVFDLAAVYQHLVAQGRLAGFEIAERFYEIGSHEGLEETRALLAGIARHP